ncbi:MAG: pyridoxal phosphate-dependent aminotransferase [Gemmatimonadota bacterium]|nr:pyridoxal phosphate-dependent aminotransferase [Gemmatimonadota bacterium]
MPDFHPFELEHYQSRFEHTVDINLADSSVKCVDVGSWLDPDQRDELLSLELFYPQVNGLERLRRKIAALYEDTTPDEVLVTNGAAQANHLVAETLLRPGDGMVWLSPGYQQLPGLARNLGCDVRDVPMDPDRDWAVDWDAFDARVTDDVRLVGVVNPNNPTGRIFEPHEMERIVAACERVGAWLHADEVYHGTELDGEPTPSFRGMYDKLVVTNSLSKAYGLAGLRIGWAVAGPDTVQELWRRHEYQVIAAAAPSMVLADAALTPVHHSNLLERQRTLSRAGHDLLGAWLDEQDGLFSVGRRQATSIAFVRYHLDAPSLEVAERIRQEASILTAPGSFLGAEGHLRITVGYEPERIRPALDRVASVVRTLQ